LALGAAADQAWCERCRAAILDTSIDLKKSWTPDQVRDDDWGRACRKDKGKAMAHDGNHTRLGTGPIGSVKLHPIKSARHRRKSGLREEARP
jgi:hypothetical protein